MSSHNLISRSKAYAKYFWVSGMPSCMRMNCSDIRTEVSQEHQQGVLLLMFVRLFQPLLFQLEPGLFDAFLHLLEAFIR